MKEKKKTYACWRKKIEQNIDPFFDIDRIDLKGFEQESGDHIMVCQSSTDWCSLLCGCGCIEHCIELGNE